MCQTVWTLDSIHSHTIKSINYEETTHAINSTVSPIATTQTNEPASGHQFFLMNNYNFLSTLYDFYYNSRNIITIDLNTKYVTEVIRFDGNATRKVARMIFNNSEIRHDDVDLSDCLSSNCETQSSSYLTTAAVHTDSHLFYLIMLTLYMLEAMQYP